MNITVSSTNKSIDAKSVFINDLVKIVSIQIVYQIFLTLFIYAYSIENQIETVQYLNISGYFLISIIAIFSLKYTIANRPLVILFIIEFSYFAISSLIILAGNYLSGLPEVSELTYNTFTAYYQLNQILLSAFCIFITAYLFFYSISPKKEETKKHIIFALIIVVAIIFLSFFNINIFTNYIEIGTENFNKIINEVKVNSKYVYLINLSFLLFVWFTYNQGHYILSEYLPAILSIHTLMVTNEIYQVHQLNNERQMFIDAQYFSFVVIVGYVFLWIIRMNYLTKPESKKTEHYVLNYDLLKGFVNKPYNSIWSKILVKLGKQKLFIGSMILFLIISIPLLFLGDINHFTKYNIILMVFFCLGVMIYAIIYTQRKWFNHIGFLIRRDKKDKN